MRGEQITKQRALTVASLSAAGAMGSTLVGMAVRYRRRSSRDAERLRVLADLAAVAASGQPRERVAQAVAELAVPRVADLCTIELQSSAGVLERLGVFIRDDRELAAALRGGRPPAGVLAPTRRHLTDLDDEGLRELAADDGEVALWRRTGVDAAVVVPLVARGRPFGRLILGSRRRVRRLSTAADVEYAQTLAGRAALALENAALSDELWSTELQLHAILESVDAAIIVRDIAGRMVYANGAAAELLRLPDMEALRTSPPGSIMARFDVYSETGEPLDLGEMPGSHMLAGRQSSSPLVARNVVKATGEERWLLNKARPVEGPDGGLRMVVNLIEDITETKRSEIAQRLLTNAARRLTADDLSPAFQAIAEAAVPGLADWAGVDILDGSGAVQTMAIAHRDPDKVRLGWRLRGEWPVSADEPDGLPAVIRTGEPQLVPEITDEMITMGARDPEHLEVLRAVGLNSTMIAPIRAGDHILGALSFVSSTSRRFDQRDLELACDVGRQVGVMIYNAQLNAEQAQIARTLQAGLIPQGLPELEGWTVSSAYRAAGAANEVGGDFFDIVRFDGGWVAVIGDVLGKGAAAASLTALVRHTVGAIVESTGDVCHALQVLNRRLRERDEDFRSLCTLAVLEFLDGGDAAVYSAGHPLPVVSGPDGVRTIGAPSPMLGFMDDIAVRRTPVEVAAGESVVLYTDGVLDAIGDGRRFGEEGLMAALGAAQAGGGSAAEAILSAIDDFLASEQTDDIAVLSLTRVAVPAVST